MPPFEFLLLWGLAVLLVAALLTEGCILYARRRGLVDHEGPRRSHAGAVPRGGGLAIVLAVLGACWLITAGGWVDGVSLLPFALALAAIAAIGWWDDHQPLPAAVRLLVHVVAVAAFTASALGGAAGWMLPLLAVLLLVTAVNFWNFMDGIDGIAALQALFVAAVLVHAFARSGDAVPLLLAITLAAACLGFLPFNLGRARIFLGDVGSGGLGFAIGALLLVAVQRGALDLWSALLLPIAFWLDAGLTLAARMAGGRRWYTAHREHLYQWLVRRGHPHLRVDALFAAWNLLIVLPAYSLIASGFLPSLPTLAFVAAAGAATWIVARRRLLQGARLYGFR